jgi:RND superfamily putative drug exporter
MSSQLYRLGRAVARRRRGVIALWITILLLGGATAGLLQKGTDDSVNIPGASSIDALWKLRHVFPQMSGTSAQILMIAPQGHDIDDPRVRAEVAETVEELRQVPQVIYVRDPFNPSVEDTVNGDRDAALIHVYLSVDLLNVTPETKERVTALGEELSRDLDDRYEVHIGGEAFGDRVPELSPTEGIGLLVALVVLVITFGSLVAAGLPLVSALLGVGISAAGVYTATAFTPVMSTSPMIAVMLGLAVGIDYALFILTRYREELGRGLSVEESIARANATAGSSVVVAGLTVIIALLGLSLVGIPFLTTMGISAAGGVAVAVLVAVTGLPAMVAVAGERLRPKERSGRGRRKDASARRPHRIAYAWISLVTARPLITVLVLAIGLGITAIPAKDLRLALPDNGTLDEGVVARDTYDLVTEHFGPGFNAPMLVMLDVLPSTDPITLVNDLAEEIKQVEGVEAVPLATPNETGDTAIIQVIPTTGPDEAGTEELARRLRGMSGHIKETYGVDSTVTGITVVGIDISRKLADAMLPFGLVVVGMSILLLTMVFRSIAVPLKAALGYLLSVGAAFGATSFVFVHGHFAEALNVQRVGSVISFLPIILMGVLFGLAMDYEMFLVSRMREHYVHHRDARAAVREGFAQASTVVTAAAVIMLGVFAAFVPEADSSVKPVAFGLAVGVFVDAFLVRMALVPAVLTMLGDRAWWIPSAVDRRLPVVDVEGDGLVRELRIGSRIDELVEDGTHPAPTVLAQDLTLRNRSGDAVVRGLNAFLPPGRILLVRGEPGSGRTDLLHAVAGRIPTMEGDLYVDGDVLPQRRQSVRRRVALVRCREGDPVDVTRSAVTDGSPLLLIDDLDLCAPSRRRAMAELIRSALTHGSRPASAVITCADPAAVLAVLGDLPTDHLSLSQKNLIEVS